jgi:hypothetical protein
VALTRTKQTCISAKEAAITLEIQALQHFRSSFMSNCGSTLRILFFSLVANALSIPAGEAIASEEKANPITGYELVLMPATKVVPFFGWIRLLNGQDDAGFIYLDDVPARDPELIGTTKQYIITSMPTASLPMLLDVLRHEKPLEIRFYDPQTPGSHPSVFLAQPASGVTTSAPFHLNEEMSANVKSRLNQR